MNQTGWLSLADFHKARAFQTRDQINTISKAARGIPSCKERSASMFAMDYLGN